MHVAVLIIMFFLIHSKSTFSSKLFHDYNTPKFEITNIMEQFIIIAKYT